MTSNENVRHVNLSVIEGATPSTNLMTISREFLSGNITAFTLDLADSRYFYLESNVFSNSLGGGSPRIYNTVFFRPLAALTAFSGQIVIFSPPTRMLVAFSTTDVQSSNARGVTAMTMYRSVLQPLPGE